MDDSVEILKGCFSCGSLPKLSTTFDYKQNYTYICCRVSRKSPSPEAAAEYWNMSNSSSNKTYKKNRKLNKWELLENAK